MPRQNPADPPPECFEGIDAWAAEVTACLSADELDLLIGIHAKIARNRRVSTGCRRLARKQAQALRRCKKQKP